MCKKIKHVILKTDVLIIGGGTTGCYAALEFDRYSELKVVVAEKTELRSGGRFVSDTNQSYAGDADKTMGFDPFLTAAETFDDITADMDKYGFVISKDAYGNFTASGERNVRINGNRFQHLLAHAVLDAKNITVLNVNITDLLVNNNRVEGAVGFHIMDDTAYEIWAGAVIVSSGRAAGLFGSHNPYSTSYGRSYPTFNTGAGYAMGIRAGAEMTSFERRYDSVRAGEIKDISRGIHSIGVLNIKGAPEPSDEFHSSSNTPPCQTLKWTESIQQPSADADITNVKPYIEDDQLTSGYWVDMNGKTTIHGLYAAGDVAGGPAEKYVTGSLAEGAIAARDIIKRSKENITSISDSSIRYARDKIQEYQHYLNCKKSLFQPKALEEAMQQAMDEHGGGISAYYVYNEEQLKVADEKISQLYILSDTLNARDMSELMFIYGLKERLEVCRFIIAHLLYKKESEWHSVHECADDKEIRSEHFEFINSKLVNGGIQVGLREIYMEEVYEHQD